MGIPAPSQEERLNKMTGVNEKAPGSTSLDYDSRGRDSVGTPGVVVGEWA
jgi:hypothetical protein